MINVQENFKIDLRTYGRQFNIKLKVNNSDFNADNLNYIKPSFTTPLFKTIMHQIELDSKVFMSKDTKISGRIGVKVNEKNYKYIDLNNYYVQSCERQEDTNSYRVLAYSKMKEAMVDYDLSFAGKITVRNYLIKVCERLGWNTDNIPATFINSEKMIDPNLHTGIKYSFRDALDEIATITCSFLMFKGDNFYLLYLTETNETIDESYLDEDNVTIGEKYLINSLVFSRAEESDNIYRKDNTSITANGLHEYRIADCQLLSTNDRADYIDEMFNYLKTLEFYIFDVQSKGILFLEACDLFNFKLNNTTYKVALLNDEINIDDGLTENLFLDKPEETETEYKYADSTDKRIDQAYILVDKQNKKITQLTKETTENSEKITKVEQDINGVTTKVSSVETEINSLKETTVNKVQVQYALGDTLTTPPTAGWSETAPEWQAGKYMWQKTVTTYSDGATKESKATCIQGAKGETGTSGTDGKDGTNGKNGNDGRGIASTVITYQASSSGTTTPTGTWQSTIPTVTAGHYLWIKTVINYTSGEPTTSYSVSMMGKTGANGKNGTSISITSKSVTYQIGTSGTTTPTGTWSTSVPTLESGKYLWTKTYVKYSDSSETTSYAVSYCAKDGVKGDKGATGKGIKSIQDQYYLSTSNTTQTGGAWKNTQDAWKSGKYIWTRSHITWSDDTTTDTTPILAESLNTANENAVLAQEKTAEQKIEIDSIKQTVSQTQTTVANNYTEIKQKFGDYAPKSDVITLQNSVERIQTDTYTKTEINTKLTDGSVTKVTTTCGTFDENGLTIEKTNAKTKGNFNEKGMKVVDATGSSEEILLFAGYDEKTDETIVKSKNMTVEKYLTIGANCRFEDYVNPVLGGKGTGAFTL